MVTKAIELVSQDSMDAYISQAAMNAGYEKGFGIMGCDLSLPIWWAGYCRQSLDEQAHNNRLPEYLLTLAKMARDQGVVVPREYIFYDHVSGEHLSRPNMEFLRHELMDKKKIIGILFADMRGLSREPAPQQVFERECEIRGVRLIFGDAPSGMDIGSQFARSAITFSNKLTRLATNRNARAGNIGRVLKGWVPSQKAAYGYVYRRDAEIGQNGRIQIKKAWWEINGADAEGKPVPGSPADTIKKIFHWIGNEGHTSYWVAKKLNEIGIKSPSGGLWVQNSIRYLLLNHCYTGNHKYNAYTMVPNPERPLGDITGAVRRTLRRLKVEGEAIEYHIPPLVTEELWLKANKAIRDRGRGMGKEGKTIHALLRNRIFCPQCGRPLVIRGRRSDNKNKFYYNCSKVAHAPAIKRCDYRKFIPGAWDETVWDCVYAILRDDSLVQNQLSLVSKQNHNIDRVIQLEQQKIFQSNSKIAKVREGFEGGLYNLDEAKSKVIGYQETINKAEREIVRLKGTIEDQSSTVNIEELEKEFKTLAQQNLDDATFAEKQDIVNKLGIKVYPSEDLKTMKICCALNFGNDSGTPSSGGCRIIQFASSRRSSQ